MYCDIIVYTYLRHTLCSSLANLLMTAQSFFGGGSVNTGVSNPALQSCEHSSAEYEEVGPGTGHTQKLSSKHLFLSKKLASPQIPPPPPPYPPHPHAPSVTVTQEAGHAFTCDVIPTTTDTLPHLPAHISSGQSSHVGKNSPTALKEANAKRMLTKPCVQHKCPLPSNTLSESHEYY